MLTPVTYESGRAPGGKSFNVSHIDALLTTAFLARTNCYHFTSIEMSEMMKEKLKIIM